MLLRLFGVISLAVGTVVCLLCGAYESYMWLWLLPLVALGSLIVLLAGGFLYLVILANRVDLERNLPQSCKAEDVDESRAYAVSGHGGMAHDPVQEKPRKRGRSIKTMEEDNA